ncbi:hypothetical protein NL108_018210, partial [Boleophthalmus pectinirostris]
IAVCDIGCCVLQPCVDMVVHVSEALVSAEALSSSNLLKVTVETAFSVPDSWTLPSGSSPTASSYTAALEVPLTTEKNQMLVFFDGTLKAGGLREERGRQKKRPFLSQLLPSNTVVPGAFIEPESVENEDGELRGQGDLLFRKEAETKKTRVSWDVEMCCFLNQEATNRLRKSITKCKLWPVEIMRSMDSSKGVKNTYYYFYYYYVHLPVSGQIFMCIVPVLQQLLEETTEIPFHGVAFVDMGRLLFPGATRIRGAYCVQPFSESLLSNKAKRSVSVLNKYAKAVATAARTTSAKKGAVKRSAKKVRNCNCFPNKVIFCQMVLNPKLRFRSELSNGASDRVVPQLYLEARTYVMIEISLEKPLIPKTPPEELSRRVMALIPPKPPLAEGPTKAQSAVQNFSRQVAKVVSHVCEQVEELYGKDCSLSEMNREHMKAEVMGELNMSGRYFTFKEQLKNAIIRIVRDKMQRTESITNPRELQEFVSKLYIYLVDETHVALNKIYTDEIDVETEGFHLSQAQLRHFAKEAQSVGDYNQALQYYEELLVRNPTDPLHKYDLGSYYMLTGDYMKAGEYYRYAVATDQSHQPSLIMCGVLAFMSEQYTNAQTFLKQAATMESYGVEAWTLLGLLYQSQEDAIQCEGAFLEANKLLRAKEDPKLKEVRKFWSELAERGAEERAKMGTKTTPLTPPQQTEHHQGLTGRKRQNIYCCNAEAWALKGHCLFLQGSLSSAKDSYECSLSFQPPPQNPHLVLLRLGDICQQEGQFEQAKLVHLQACEQSPSCLTWLGLGAACYR